MFKRYSICISHYDSLTNNSIIQRRFSNDTLANINVVDMTRIIAGPYCTMLLGDLGANVIKIESLDGDESRKWGPPFIANNKDSCYYLSVNRNKKSICIDLKLKYGKEVFYDIVKKSDIMVENFVPGKLDSLDVGYEKLKTVTPDLIYCTITGHGQNGPYAYKPGYDVIAAAMAGLLHATGEKDGDPVKVGVAMTDLATGLHAFGAIQTALYHRAITGEGQRIDCNLLSTQISCMINLASCYLNAGIEPKRWGTEHANIVPYQAFKTKNGFIVIGTGSNLQFRSFCELIGKSEWANDSKYSDNSLRVLNREDLIQKIKEVIVTKTTKEWCNVFKEATFPNGPVNTMKDVFEDEHVKSTGIVHEVTHSDGGVVKIVGPPTVYSKTRNIVRSAPPTLGEHTRTILEDFLNYSDDEIEKLFRYKIVH